MARHGHVPLSFAQEGLWYFHQLHGRSSNAYHLSHVMRMTGPLHVPALVAALNTIVDRHEVLRTVFSVADGEPRQVVLPRRDLELPVEDVITPGSHDPDTVWASVEAIVRHECEMPFDLEEVPPVRQRLLRIGDQDHVIVRTVHHIASDGWSTGIFLRELSLLYKAFRAGRPNPLAPLPLQFADFALWQREAVTDESMEASALYWKRQLHELPDRVLPTDRSRSAAARGQAATLEVSLRADTLVALKQTCTRGRLTLHMALVAGLGLMVGRYTGGMDTVVGSHVAHRPDARLEGLIGCFVNTLPIRVRAAHGQTLATALQDVRQATLDAHQHRHYPFEYLVRELRPSAVSSGARPLFHVLMNLRNMPRVPAGLDDVQVETRPHRAVAAARYDVEVNAQEQAGELSLSWVYDAGLFDRWRIQQMAAHYLRVLDALAAEPDARADTVELLTRHEREQVLTCRTTRAIPSPSLPDLFDAQAGLTPDRIALITATDHVSYETLRARVTRVAHVLRTHGAGPEQVIAIALDRSTDMVTALLAVLASGAAYMPLDLNYPAQRLAAMVNEARPLLVLTTRRHQGRVPAAAQCVVCLDARTTVAAIRRAPGAGRRARVHPDQAAYVIFTSGSTGRPKGVIGLHRGVANRLAWFADTFPFSPDRPSVARSPLSFVDALTELLAPLSFGGCVVVADDTEAYDPHLLALLMERRRIGLVTVMPALLPLLLNGRNSERLACCELWVSSGQRLRRSHASLLDAAGPSARLINLYGSTEASGDSLCNPAARSDRALGHPIWNAHAYVLDDHLEPSPLGVIGEIYIAGAGLARGYLRRPGWTAARFVADPHGGEGARMYRTGDLAWRRPDGALEFVGRADAQVKVNGVRIELGEIEAALGSHPGVQDVVALLRETSGGDEALAAYVLPTLGTLLEASQLREELLQKVPSAMVPHFIQILERWPLTVNGKIDYAALRAAEIVPPRAAYRPPRNWIEERVSDLFADVLGVSRCGIDDDFFALGGHSLTAMELVSRVRLAFGVALSLRTLFGTATIAGVARHLAEALPPDAAGGAFRHQLVD